jgi:hypothetical protein
VWYRQYARLAEAILRIAYRLESLGSTTSYLDRIDVRSIMDVTLLLGLGGPLSSVPTSFIQGFALRLQHRWEALDAKRKQERQMRMPVSRADARAQIANWVNWWMAMSSFEQRLEWIGGEARLVTWGGRAWGAIGRALASVILRGEHGAYCNNCGSPVRLTRRPAVGRRYWCSDRGCQRVMWAEQKRRSRQHD